MLTLSRGSGPKNVIFSNGPKIISEYSNLYPESFVTHWLGASTFCSGNWSEMLLDFAGFCSPVLLVLTG